MKIFGIIYKAVDKLGKYYIGKHIGDGSDIGKTYFGSGKYFRRALNKHGKDYFTYSIIEYCYSSKQLNEMEVYYIKLFQSRVNGYNIAKGGDGGDLFKGHQHTEEIKKKISKSMLGKNTGPRSDEVKDKLIKTWKYRSKEEKIEYSKTLSSIWNSKSDKEKAEINKKRSDTSKITQNLPEVKKKKSERLLGVSPHASKTLEEIIEIKKKISESKIGVVFIELAPCDYCGKIYKHLKWMQNHSLKIHGSTYDQIVG